jgi:exopolysaccharide/PEP-CTERM locus tyrosine autokinase
MGIFEKAFEKAGKDAVSGQEDELFSPVEKHSSYPDLTAGDEIDSSITRTAYAADAETVPVAAPPTNGIPRDGGKTRQIKLDLDGLKAAGLVDPFADKTNRTGEEFRSIKRPLLMNARGQGATVVDNANMIMVTSAVAGEGKTFTAINLALSIAMEMDKTVLLVDADVAKPDVTTRLGVQAETGLIDVLLDEGLMLSDVLLRTDIPKLTLLPAGRKHVHATELLASERMRQLALEISSRYSDRIVIFDSPPMLLTNEAAVLAGLMGQLVLVVEESTTPQHIVKEAVAMLDANQIVGVVLNKGRRQGAGRYGGYGYYGYGYGYGYGNGK